MKKILILSGKGGTGKTTIASAFIEFSKSSLFADCDVDAPNLDLIIKVDGKKKENIFYGMPKAEIDEQKCIKCGKCLAYCRFGAVKKIDTGYVIDKTICEGCGVCLLKCPVNAINLNEYKSGDVIEYIGKDKMFSTAKLKMGSENSGKLVSKVKETIFNNEDKNEGISIIDGSPGIGCPVISSIAGVDFVLIVAEPSVSGISDMKRIISTVKRFNINLAVCINKFDVNIQKTNEIEDFCLKNKIECVGKISYAEIIPKTINKLKNIADIDSNVTKEILEVYNNTIKLLYEK